MKTLRVFLVTIVFVLVMSVTASAYAATAYYYSPHPDDETYGMAHSIRYHLEQGVSVVGVLLTDGENSAYYSTWATEHPYPEGDLDGDGGVDRMDFGLARRAEYVAAMHELGVTVFSFRGVAGPHSGTGFVDGGLTQAQVESVIMYYEAKVGTEYHKTTMKYISGNPTVGDYQAHNDHTAACNALNRLADVYGYDARFYKVYEFNKSYSTRTAPYVETATSARHTYKQNALDEYSEIGYHSTTTLWTNSYSDLREFLVKPTNF